jgi:hypothetical protein
MENTYVRENAASCFSAKVNVQIYIFNGQQQVKGGWGGDKVNKYRSLEKGVAHTATQHRQRDQIGGNFTVFFAKNIL